MNEVIEQRKRGRGRPSKYNTDEERRAVRAKAARERRAKKKEQGYKEVRRLVRVKKDDKPSSSIIDLSAIHNNKRD